ncbi:TIGR02186 family protein [Microbaculum marinum]|uniref:TIGR02186 family protein n=1 Tax=Microbaculum marinum TaxID=1764581 RepID=A0AAW9RPW3_9HYPH
MMRAVAALVFCLASFTALPAARAESVIAALSEKVVEIRSNFVGTEIVLFGSVERDGETVGRAHGYDVVVVIEGPRRDIVVWRKERVAGIWVNGAGIEYRNAPSYYAVLSNRPLEEIAGPVVLRRKGIGRDYLPLEAASEESEETVAVFRDALLRRKEAQSLYFSHHDAVDMLTPSLFMAHIPLPANIRTGGYRAQVHVFGDGALLATSRVGFWVIKTGFEAAVYDLAHRQPLVYGLATVAMAFGVGWLGSVMFRRN